MGLTRRRNETSSVGVVVRQVRSIETLDLRSELKLSELSRMDSLDVGINPAPGPPPPASPILLPDCLIGHPAAVYYGLR